MVLSTITAALTAAMLGGCVPDRNLRTGAVQAIGVHGTSEADVSVDTLARKLGFSLVESSAAMAKLARAENTVLLFPGSSESQAYLNGQAIAGAGPIRTIGGILHVSRKLEGRIRTELESRPAKGAEAGAAPQRAFPARRASLGRIVIDPGHGGRDTGTDAAVRKFGYGNLYEKTVNLSISMMIDEMLRRRGVEVVMTRRSDRTVSLKRRVAIANSLRYPPDLFVSIHANSIPDETYRGFMVLVARSASRRSYSAARCIMRRLRETALQDKGLRKDGRGLRVLWATRCPAVLVETAFMTNLEDAKLLADPTWQRRIAAAIADGICDYLEKG